LEICPGDSVQLGRWGDGRNLLFDWQPAAGLSDPASVQPMASPAQTTTYTLTVRLKPDAEHDCADRQSDTASVTVVVRNAPPPFSLGPDAALCPPQWPVQLAAPDAAPESNYAYRWSTGDTSKSIEVVSAGEYVLSITSADGFCSQADTVLLRAADLPTMPDWQSHYELCNESRQISLSVVPQPDFQYRWSDGSTETQRRFTATGNYVFSITTPEGCTDTISVSFTSYPKISLSADPEPDSDWCPRTDGSVTLTTRPNRPQFRYTWNTGATGHRLEVDSAGLYRIRVQFSELCVDSAQLELSTLCLDAVFIPNAFSPNGDGLNEVWHVLGGPFSNFECTIYDRWGHTRFTTTDVNRVWDGSSAPEGSYAVVVRYRLSGQRDVRQVVGTVQLVR